jgi:hypothetical protein
MDGVAAVDTGVKRDKHYKGYVQPVADVSAGPERVLHKEDDERGVGTLVHGTTSFSQQAANRDRRLCGGTGPVYRDGLYGLLALYTILKV